jgi:hypothetical protein
VGGWGNSSSKAFGISFADRPKAKKAEKDEHFLEKLANPVPGVPDAHANNLTTVDSAYIWLNQQIFGFTVSYKEYRVMRYVVV